MFDIYCPDHGSRILLFTNDIEEIQNTEEGIEVHYRCTCGYRGVWITGRTKGNPRVTRESRDHDQGAISQDIA